MLVKGGTSDYGACAKCRAPYKRIIKKGAVDTLLLSEDLDDDVIESYEEKAEKIGAKINTISVESQEGKQLKDFGGIAAILRFRI